MLKELTKIGFISKPFGFNGDLKCGLEIIMLTEKFPKFVWIYIDGKPVPFFVEKHYFHNNSLILKFEDISDEKKAYSFKNTSFYCEKNIFEKYFEREENLNDFIGFKVGDVNKGEIGKISSIIENTIQPTLVLDFKGKEILIPYSEGIILEIDEEKQIIKIDAPEGLIDLYLDN